MIYTIEVGCHVVFLFNSSYYKYAIIFRMGKEEIAIISDKLGFGKQAMTTLSFDYVVFLTVL